MRRRFIAHVSLCGRCARYQKVIDLGVSLLHSADQIDVSPRFHTRRAGGRRSPPRTRLRSSSSDFTGARDAHEPPPPSELATAHTYLSIAASVISIDNGGG